MNTFIKIFDFAIGVLAVSAFVALMMNSSWFIPLAAMPIGWMTGMFISDIIFSGRKNE